VKNLITTTMELKNSCKLWVYVHNHNTAVCNITYLHHSRMSHCLKIVQKWY